LNHLLQLGLNKRRKSNSGETDVTAIWLIEQLLELISENASEGVEDRDSSFCSKLERPKQEILGSSSDTLNASAANETLDLCRHQFEHTRTRRRERDENFAEIILFLRESLVNLSGDSRKYHESLTDTAERIGRLSDLKDILELKTRVAVEVKELNRIVEEKQQQERTQYAELSQKVEHLQSKLEKVKEEASIDSLTGIANRRHFEVMIQRWVQDHNRNEEPFTVALLDLDNFKQVNDSYGHQTGDQVLTHIAHTLRSGIRPGDFLARYGGEEFVILSKGMKLEESDKRYSEMLSHIENTPIDCRNSGNECIKIALTASCGVAGYALGEKVEDLINRADQALYEAKRTGKNRVVTKRRSLLGAFYEGRKRNTGA